MSKIFSIASLIWLIFILTKYEWGRIDRLEWFFTITASLIVASKLRIKSGPATVRAPKSVLWLDASDKSTIELTSDNKVCKWLDKSGKENHLLQNKAGHQPFLIEEAINGKAVMNFDGNSFLQNLNVPELSQPYTIFILLRTGDQTSETQRIFDGGSSKGQALVQITGDTKLMMFAGHNLIVDHTLSEGEAALLTLVYDSSHSKSYVNGVLDSEGDVGLKGINAITLGSFFHGKQGFFTGSIAEIIVFSSELDEAARVETERYLSNKWGVSMNLD